MRAAIAARASGCKALMSIELLAACGSGSCGGFGLGGAVAEFVGAVAASGAGIFGTVPDGSAIGVLVDIGSTAGADAASLLIGIDVSAGVGATTSGTLVSGADGELVIG